jgi:hypothetical protein
MYAKYLIISRFPTSAELNIELPGMGQYNEKKKKREIMRLRKPLSEARHTCI